MLTVISDLGKCQTPAFLIEYIHIYSTIYQKFLEPINLFLAIGI